MEEPGRATYALFVYLSLPWVLFLVKGDNKNLSEVPKFRVNFLSIIYTYPVPYITSQYL